MGFVTPIAAWFPGALADEAGALAQSRTLVETGWFDTLWQFVNLDRSLRHLSG